MSTQTPVHGWSEQHNLQSPEDGTAQRPSVAADKQSGLSTWVLFTHRKDYSRSALNVANRFLNSE